MTAKKEKEQPEDQQPKKEPEKFPISDEGTKGP